MDDMTENIEPKRGRPEQRSVLSLVCGKNVKKYRMKSKLVKRLNVNYHQIRKGKDGIRKMRKALERKQVSQNVVQFLEREDNSACLPGKRDATKSGNEKVQTRILSDYMYNLHLKYKFEHPDSQISLTTFSSFRPKHIKLVHFSSRMTFKTEQKCL